MAKKVPDLAFTFDNASGVISSLSSQTGYLTEPKSGQEALPVVMDFLTSNAAMLGMNSKDLSSLEVTDRVYSKVTGTTHIFMRQVHDGLPVYNSQMQVNLNREQRILSVNNSAMTDMATSANVKKPGIDLSEAVGKQRSISVFLCPIHLKQSMLLPVCSISHRWIPVESPWNRFKVN